MREQYAKIIGQIITIGIIVLVFAIPLLFIPLPQSTNDARIFAEFNKQIFLVLGSLILFSLWTFKMVLEKKVTIVRTPIDVPLLIFIVVFALATVFSTDLFVSIAGFYGLFHPAFLSVFALILFYFTTVSNLNTKTRLFALVSLLSSVVIISLINIFNFFGWFIVPYEFAKVREWTPLLSLGTMSFLASLSIPVSIGFALQTKTIWIRIAGLAFAIILFAPLLIVNSFGAWFSLFAATAIFLVLAPRIIHTKADRVSLAVTGACALVLLVVALTPTLRDNLIQPLIQSEDKSLSISTERRLSLEAGWQVGSRAAGKKPFLGSGPGTFPFASTAHAPLSLNQTDNWNIRFEQASNEYVNLITSVGILGLAAFVLVLFFLIKPLALFSTSGGARENPLAPFLLASLGGYVVGSFFFDTSLVVGIFFVLIAAVAFSTLNSLGAKGVDRVNLKLVSLNAGAIRTFSGSGAPSYNLLGYILFVPAVIATGALLYLSSTAYRAEVSYQGSIISASENKATETRDKLLSAIKTFGYRDVYHRTLALVDLRIAQNLSQQEEKNEQTTTNIQLLVREAIDQGKIASGYQNPEIVGTSKANVVNWETVALVYSNLIGAAQGAENHATQTYLGAIARQPRNPLLYEALGKVYLRTKQTDEAIRALETAVSLKPDLSSTHYTLAQAYKQAGDRDMDVARELLIASELLPEGPEKERVLEEIDEIEETLEKTQEQPSQSTTSATPAP
jgi:tetratricopeptide (TPR) repeat protein